MEKCIKMTTDNHDAAGNKATLLVSYEVAKLFIEVNNINDQISHNINIISNNLLKYKPLLIKQQNILKSIRILDSDLNKWDLRTRWVVDVTQYERDLKLNGLL